MAPYITINGRRIGPGYPAYIIAEMSANHGQDFELAVAILEAAQAAGADAVKIQTYTPETMTLDCDTETFRIGEGSPWAGQNLFALYGEAYTPWEWQPELQTIAGKMGLDFFSTPFDSTAVDFLEEMKVSAYKVASFELVDLPLLRRIAQTFKPVIMSTGMASLAEIEEAVDTLRANGADQIALLKCTSAYPAPPDEANLRTIPDLAERFRTPVGLSDHTLDIVVPIVSVSVGACVIEKHLTLARSMGGPDSAFSLEPQEFAEMVAAVRTAEKALGEVRYGASEHEVSARAFRRSLFVVEDVRAGEPFTETNVRVIRPGSGLPPRHFESVIGRVACRDIARGTPLDWDLIAEGQ